MKSTMSIENSAGRAVVGRVRMATALRRRAWKPPKTGAMADQIYTMFPPGPIPPQEAGQCINARRVSAARAVAKPAYKPVRIALRGLRGGRRCPGSVAAVPVGDPPTARASDAADTLPLGTRSSLPRPKNPFSPGADSGAADAGRRTVRPNGTAAGRRPRLANRLAPPHRKEAPSGPPRPRPSAASGTSPAASCPARRACRAARGGLAC